MFQPAWRIPKILCHVFPRPMGVSGRDENSNGVWKSRFCNVNQTLVHDILSAKSWLVKNGILISHGLWNAPYITGVGVHPLYTANNQGFGHCSSIVTSTLLKNCCDVGYTHSVSPGKFHGIPKIMDFFSKGISQSIFRFRVRFSRSALFFLLKLFQQIECPTQFSTQCCSQRIPGVFLLFHWRFRTKPLMLGCPPSH